MNKPYSSLDSGRVIFRLFEPGNVVDPVCGKEMPKEDALATSSHRGETRYFCSDACKASFLEEPEAYS